MQKVYTKIESIVGNVVTVRASGVRSGDLALVGESYASVIKLSGDLVSLQVFAGTQGVSTTDTVRFLGRPMMVSFSDDLLGRVFDGAGFAAQASVGAWKKCYANGKPAPFIMVAFSGAPLTQTIYGFLLMNFIRSAVASGADPALAMFTGIFAGLAIGLSAFFQGKVAAASADALGETGKGTANFFIVIGIIETVALFTLVFSLLLLQ